MQRKYNRKLYTDFKEEVCLRYADCRCYFRSLTFLRIPRYLYKFHIEGALHSPLAENALEECRKIKSVVKLGAEVCPKILRSRVMA